MNLLSKAFGRIPVLPSFWVVAWIAAASIGHAAGIPWTNDQASEFFLGSGTGGGTTGLSGPNDVAIDAAHGKLYVADYNNHRVLRFAYPLTANTPVAEAVFGQADFTGTAINRGGSPANNTMHYPAGVAVAANGDLWVLEAQNFRAIKIPAAYSAANGAAATVVLGQVDMNTVVSAGGSTSQSTFSYPGDICIDSSGTLWVADTGNNRILRFDNVASKTNGANADGVLGQANYAASGGGTAANTLNSPYRICVAGGRLWVAEYSNNRVLRFDAAASKANGASANGVLGQANFTSGLANRGGSVAANTLSSPYGVAEDAAGTLYVSDFGNSRVLIFSDAASKADGAAADNYLGAGSFTATGTLAASSQVYDDVLHRLEVIRSNQVYQYFNCYTTTTAIASSLNPSTTLGATVTFTATVTTAASGPTATGTVNFKEGATILGTGTLNGSGVATFATSSLSDGDHSIVAEYQQSATHQRSASSALTQVIGKFTPTITLTASANPSAEGNSITFTATVTRPSGTALTPTGTVAFTVGGTTQSTVAMSGGVATWTTSALTAGTYSMTAVYSGDTNFRTVTSSTLSQIVNPAGLVTVTAIANTEHDINGTTDEYILGPEYGNMLYVGAFGSAGTPYPMLPAYKFNLSSVTGTITSATLKLRVGSDISILSTLNVNVYGSNDDTWTETKTAASVPASKITPAISTFSATSLASGDWVSIPVTDFVKAQFTGDQVASFVLDSSANLETTNYITFWSREAGVGYAPILEIQTSTGPTVTTQAASGVTATTATGNGNITATGGANATARGVIYWAYNNTDRAIGDSGVTNVAESGNFGTGAFAASLTSLSVNTQYNARAYATSPNGTGYGARVAFWTLANVPSAPTVNGATATTLNVAVNANGNPTTTEFCIQETSTGNYVQAGGSLGASAAWQTAATWGTKTVTGLTTGSTYTFQVKARNGAATETVYGATASGMPFAAPTVTTQAASGVTATSATGNGNITATGGANATARGVIYWAYNNTDRAIGDSGVTNVAESGNFGTGAFAASLTSLSVNTQYNARAYATSPNGTGYGARVAFWTLASVPSAPTVNGATATTLNVAVNANGNPATTAFCIQETSTGNYVQAGGSLGAGQVWQTAATWGTKTVTGLTTGSTYTFQVKARNGAATETAYGATASGTAVAAPTVTGSAATSLSTTGATLNGTVNANGADATVSFDYGLTTGYGTTVAATPGTVLAGAGSTSVAANLSGLSSNTVYHFRAKGTNSVGTTNGGDLTFTTVPGVPTGVTATAGDTQASVSFTAPTGGATITGYTVTSSPGSLTATGSASPITVTGLTNGTAYTFTVTATNAAGTSSSSAASNSVTPKTAQTITFAPGAQNFGTTPTLTATASSGLAVTFSSNNTSVATITTGGVLTFLTTGTASVTAHQAGDSTYAAAPDVTQTFTVNAVVPGAPTIGTAIAGNAQASVAFTAPAFTGGAAITGYIVTSSPGSLTATGSASPITVTGLTNGTAYTFTVRATNSAGTGSASGASNSILPSAIVISPASLPEALIGTAYSQTLTASGGVAPYSYSVASGALPGGLTLTSAGSITGTPTALGTYNFTVAATDSNGTVNARAYTFYVRAVPVVTTTVGATAFTEGNNSTSVPVAIDNALTVTDADDVTLASGTVSITGNFQTAEDVLAFANDGLTMGNIAGSYNTATGVLTLTSSGTTATVAQWQAALSSVTYTNLSEAPNTTDRTIGFAVNDGSHDSAVAAKTVTVGTTDDTPTLIALSNAAIVQSAGTNAAVGTLTTTDVDSTTFTYTLVSGTGSTDNALFNISGSTLRANNATTLSAGSHSVRIQSDDGAGGLYAQSFTITVGDDVAPAAPVITTASGITANAKPTLAGTAEAGSTVKIYDGATLVTTVIADGSGNWTYTFGTALSDGAHSIIVTATDTVGNTSPASAALTLTVDTTAPAAPSTPDLATASDSGVSNTDNITNITKPTFTGSAEAGSTVELFRGGTTSLGTTTANSAGNWSLTLAADIYHGSYSITAKATDAANNTSAASSALSVIIDTIMPPPVVFITATGPTNNNRPTVQGTAEASATVTLSGDSATHTLAADSSGNWSWTPSTALADGVYGFTAYATDAAGNGGPMGLGALITVDTTAPDTTITTAPSALSASASATFVFAGSDVDGSGIASYQAKLDSGAYATVTSPLTFTGLSEGTHTLLIRAIDLAGNTDATPASHTWTIDTTAPVSPVVTTTETTTRNPQPTLTGTAEAFSVVRIYDGTTLLGTVTADSSGNWSYTLGSALTNGAHTITVTATDASGNTSSSSAGLNLTVDTVAPATPAAPSLAPASNSGALSDNVTNVNTPVLQGTAEASSSVALYHGSTQIAVIAADSAGNWSHTFTTALSDGTHAFTVTATDTAGNTSSASAELSVTIDTIAPATPIISNAAGYTTDTLPTLTGTAEASSTVALSDNSVSLASVAASSAGAWTHTVVTALSLGSHTITATATDLAGNTSAAASIVLSLGSAPAITTQPAAQTVNAGAPAAFSVVATGTATLTYTWQRSLDNSVFTTLSTGTDASYALTSATVAHTGYYRVIVSNNYGTITSSPAYLTVVPNFTAARPDGYAATTTGGGSSNSVLVFTAADFRTQATSANAATITVVGTLNLGSAPVAVASNKTIQGADANAALLGNLSLTNVSNVILRGLHLTNPGSTIVNGAYTDGGDALTISGSSRVFVTHCTFFDCADHAIKIVNGSDLITVSWCEFYASSASLLHRYGVQIGAATDTATQQVTLHHNWWTSHLDQRMPSASSGHVHLYNNYQNATGNTAGSVASDQARYLSERNVHASVASPLTKATTGKIRTIGNTYTACTGTAPDAGTDAVFTPAYSYEMLPASDVATEITALAGNNVGAGYTDAVNGTATITGPTSAVLRNTAFTLTAVPAGFTPSGYQWRFNNVAIAGATSATYTVAAASASPDAGGTYTVAITIASGDTVVSAPLNVTIKDTTTELGKVGASGGGGATGWWYLAGLGLLVGIRRLSLRTARKNT